MSLRWNFAKSSTLPGVVSSPCSLSLGVISARALFTSVFSRWVMSAGSLAGPHRPYQL